MPTETTVIIPPDDPLPPPPDRTLIATDKIAADLMAAIQANATLAASYTVVRYGSTLHIVKLGGDFTPYVADTLENTGLSVIKGTVGGLDELPDQAPANFMLRVSGDPTTQADDYWTAFKNGRWQEIAAPGMLTQLDGTQMPWVLSSTGSAGSRTFSFGPTTWTERDAGDDASNPIPPLNGIDTLFVTEGRLGFTAGDTVALSASNEPLRLFRRTVAQLLPNDPVAVHSTLGNVGRYRAAVQWDGAVQLWSGEAQRAVYGEPAITPSTISIAPTSAFASDPTCLPIVVGTRIYYASYIDGAVRVYEYSRPPGYDSLPEVRDLTESVPSYLAGRARMLVADEALGFLAVILQGTSDSVYVCHLRQGQNGSVAVWHRWQFTGAVINAARMVEGRLALLLSRSGAGVVETLDVANPADTTLPVRDAGSITVTPMVRIDQLFLQTQSGPETTSRVTVRNLTVFHKDTAAAKLWVNDEYPTVRLDATTPPSTKIRVPIMRTLETFGLTLQWIGFLTNIELQGTQVSRSRRV